MKRIIFKYLLAFSAIVVSICTVSAATPTITSFSPVSGRTGSAGSTTVIVTGTNFSTTAANNIVHFGGALATVTAATSTQLTVTAPVGATWQAMSVTVGGLTAYSYLMPNPFIPTFAGKGSISSSDFAAKVDLTTGTNPYGVVIGDLDGDGKPDLAVTNLNSTTVSVFRNTSTAGTIVAGSFAAKVDFTTGTAPRGIALGDLDGDGKSDLAVANYTENSVSVFRNTSTSGTIDATSFAAKVDFTTGTAPNGIALGDLDGDGKPDLAVTNATSATVSVFRNTSTAGTITGGSFATKVDFTTGTIPVYIAIGDMDGDGKPDLAVTNYGASTVSVLRNTATAGVIAAGSFAAKVDFTTGINPYGVVLSDLDGDGKPDMAVTNFGSNTVSIFRNTSTAGTITGGSFATKVDFTTGTTPCYLALGDLDGDGKPDLAVDNYGDATVSVLRNTATAGTIDATSFAARVDLTTGTNPYYIALADLDGDGKTDLTVTNYGSATVSILRNSVMPPTITSFSPVSGRTGSAGSTTVIVTGTNFSTTAANNIVHFGGALATVTAATSTQLTVTAPVGATWQAMSVTVGGLTAYSYLMPNPFIPTFAGKGSISSSDFAAKVDLTAGTNPFGVALGDLDGDGKPDMAVTNNGSATVSVFRNTSTAGTIVAGSFAAKVDFTRGTGPTCVALGDLDGDGKLDMAVTNYSSNTVSVFRNTSTVGTISFAAKVDFTTGTNPSSVAVGDLDGDGKPDMAVTNYGSSTVSVFQNTSTTGAITAGSFATKVNFATGNNPCYIAIGDLDGDGKPDLTVANLNSATVSVLRNTVTAGTISFAAKVDFTTGTGPNGIALGDMDGDGKPDLAVTNSGSNTVSVLFNTSTSGSMGAGSFATKVDFTTGTGSCYVALGDLDGDGKPDMAVTSFDANVVSVLRNTATAGAIDGTSFAAKVDFTTGTNPCGIALGDLDGDGKADLAVTNYGSATVSVLRNSVLLPTITSFSPVSGRTGSAESTTVIVTGTNFSTTAANNIVHFGGALATVTAATSTQLTVTAPVGATWEAMSVTVGGLTGYSYLMPNPFIPTFAGKGTISSSDFAAKVDFTTGTNPYGIALGDLDGDGKPDLAVANNGSATVSVFRNTSTAGTIAAGSFATKVDFAVGANPTFVALGDLDGDGKLDMTVANYTSNTVSVFRNTSTAGIIAAGSFAAKVDLTTGTNPICVALGDLDGDGKPDLAVANRNSATVSIFQNTSTAGVIAAGSFAAKVDLTTGTAPYGIALGDLDGDGKPDLAVVNKNSNTVSVFLNTSTVGAITTGSFATKVDFATGTAPYGVALGDLDGDGKPDLAVTNLISSTVSVLRNTSTAGAISFATKVDFTAGTNPYNIALGDLDGDGKVDLAVANNGVPTVSVFRNTSTVGTIDATSFAAKVDLTTGNTPYGIALGDLDGDGKPDLAVANNGSATVSILRNSVMPPTITSFSPVSGRTGSAGSTTVIVTGTNFSTTAANNIVYFGGALATVTAATSTQLTVTAPVGATWQAMSVTVGGQTGYSYLMPNPFIPTFAGKGTISSSDFAAKVDLTAGTNPFGIALGDLDGDGKPDLAVANFNSNTVSVFRNTSTAGAITTGSFATKVDFTTGTNPCMIALGDLDGDGKLDMAVTNYNSNTVSVFRNISTSGNIVAGSFAAIVNFTTGTKPQGVVIGDLDGDGKPDMAVTNNGSNTVSVFRNTSTVGTITAASFAAKFDFTTGTGPTCVALGDLDGDGKPDLAVTYYNSATVSVFRNTSTAGTIAAGSFAAKVDFTTGTNPWGVALGDLDGDGKPDLAVTNNGSNTVSVFRNTSTVGTITAASFAAKFDFAAGTNPCGVALGDLDGDGKPDLAVGNNGSATVSVLRNTATAGAIAAGSFAAKVDLTTGANPVGIALGDLDGDGKADLAVATTSLSILRNSVMPPTITSFSPVSGRTGSDGSTTVIVTGTNFSTTAANNIVHFGGALATVTAATSTQLTVTAPVGATWQAMSVTVGGLTGYSYLMPNPFIPTFAGKNSISSSDFAAKVDFTTGTNPWGIAIADLDGDGKPDLAVANNGSATVSVFRNTSTAGTIAAGSFAAKVDFTTGTSPRMIALGDLDGDGKPDMAVTNIISNTVSVFRNTSIVGSISFATKVDFTTGTAPTCVALGDLDGDGKPDMVTTNYDVNTVSVLRNISTAVVISFATKVDFTTGTNPNSIALGDLDGDGKPDLAVVNSGSNSVSVFRNTSTAGVIAAGSFAAKVDFTTGACPTCVALGDLDGNGKPDLAVTNLNSSTVSVLRNTSTAGVIAAGSFATKVDFTTGTNPYGIDLGDLNGDGKPDLAVVNFTDMTVSVLRNTCTAGAITAGSFATKVDFTADSGPHIIALGDLDGDGKPDMAIANANVATVSILRNSVLLPSITSFSPVSGRTGSAGSTTVIVTGTNFSTTAANNIVHFGGALATVTAATSTQLTVTAPVGATWQAMSVTVGGLTGYSYLMPNPFIPTFAGKGSISSSDFAAKVDFTTGTNPFGIALGDLDGDGKPDLAVANNGSATVSVFRNTSTAGTIAAGSFAAKVDFTTGTNPQVVVIGDLDGDGKLDMAVANNGSNTVSVFRNTSTAGIIAAGSFATKVDFTTGTNPWGVALGDLDGDGMPDMAVTNNGSNTVSVFRNTSTAGAITTGSFATKVDFTTGTAPRGVALTDLNGDGKVDLAVANYGASTVSVFQNTSTAGAIAAGSFAAKVDFTTGTNPTCVALGDLDGDGKPDMAIANYTSNTVSVLRNTSTAGAISFAAKVDFTTGNNPYGIALGDLDGDGKPDLAVANNNTPGVSVFRNTSTAGTIAAGSFAAKVDFTTGNSSRGGIALGDLDGDGEADLAVANYASNTVSILRNAAILPTITSFSPVSGRTGSAGSTTVIVTGTNFSTTAANNIVYFGGALATVTAATSTQLTVTAPVGATWQAMSVTVGGLTGYSYLMPNPFIPTFAGKGTISSSDFAAKVDFTTGTNPYGIALGDLDGDGKPDLAVANFNSNTVSVFRNTSTAGAITTGSFATKVDFTTGTNPCYLALGDLDGDGKPDLAVANDNSNTISAFRNTSTVGTISFATKVDFATGNLPQSIVLGDLDGDGKPDLAVGNNGPSIVSVLRNISTVGTISFATKVDFTTQLHPTCVALGDLDGDGKPDLVVTSNTQNTVSVLRNTSTAGVIDATSFAKVDITTGAYPVGVALGDLDGDGKPDMAIANNNANTVSVFRNTSTAGAISFAAKVDFTTGTNPIGVALGDLDGDGKPDLAVTNYGAATVSVLLNTSTSGAITAGSFAAKVDLTTGTNPVGIALGDLDGDGKADLAVNNNGSATVSILRNSVMPPTITSFTPVSGRTGSAGSTTVIVTGTNFSTTAANNIFHFGGALATVTAATSTQLTVTAPVGATWQAMSVTVGGQTGYSYLMPNPFIPTFAGKGSISSSDFAAKVDFTTGTNPWCIAIADLDGDGKPDLAVLNYNSNTVSVFRNTSTAGTIVAGSFAAKVDFTTGTKPRMIALGDLDGDGKPDMAVTNETSNTVSVLRNTSTSGAIGAGSFAAIVNFTTGTNPRAVAIGDLDGDGKPDLAVANYDAATVSVFRNTSTAGAITTGSFATKVDFTTGTNPFGVAIGDLDGDGKPDLAVTNNGSSTISVLRNTATAGTIAAGSFAAKVDFTTGTNPYGVALGDIDGDGKPDLAVANYGSNTVSVFRNTSTAGTITGGSFATKVDFTMGAGPVGVALGDLDGDGKPDLAVGNNGSATVSVLRNTATAGAIAAGSFAAKVDFTTGTNPIGVAIADLDGDGEADLAVINEGSATVSILRNGVMLPTITSFSPVSGRTGSAGSTTVIVTGTNFSTTAANNIFHFGGALATVTAATSTQLTVTAPVGATWQAMSVTVGGLTAYSYLMPNPFIPTFAGKGSITYSDFAARVDLTAGTNPQGVVIGDLDGDGKPDMAVTNYGAATVSVFRNTSTAGTIAAGSFATKVDFTTGNNPQVVVIGDLDGDGKLDMTVANYSSNTVSVFRNTSTAGAITTGSFATKVDFTTGTNPWGVALGDLDGDGKPDLAVTNNGSATVSVFRNTSTAGTITAGSFAAKVDFTTGTNPCGVALGDLDGDGKPDLAVGNNGSATVSVLRNTATAGAITTGSFATKVDFTTGTGPVGVALGDLDGDGKPDLAVANNGSATVSVLRNTSTAGAISFATKVDFTAGTTPYGIALGDLDGDGKPDIAVNNAGASTVSVLRNTSTAGTIAAGSFAAKVDFTTGTSPRMIALGDLDGDGKPDLAVANYGANKVSILKNYFILFYHIP